MNLGKPQSAGCNESKPIASLISSQFIRSCNNHLDEMIDTCTKTEAHSNSAVRCILLPGACYVYTSYIFIADSQKGRQACDTNNASLSTTTWYLFIFSWQLEMCLIFTTVQYFVQTVISKVIYDLNKMKYYWHRLDGPLIPKFCLISLILHFTRFSPRQN